MFAIDLNKDPKYNRRIVLDRIIPTFTKIEGEVVKELRKFAEKSMSTADTLPVEVKSTNLSLNLALPSFVVHYEARIQNEQENVSVMRLTSSGRHIDPGHLRVDILLSGARALKPHPTQTLLHHSRLRCCFD